MRRKKVYRQPLPEEGAAATIRRRNPKKVIEHLIASTKRGKIKMSTKKYRGSKTSPRHKEPFNFPEVDGRSVLVKKFRETYNAYTADLGGNANMSAIQQDLCMRLAAHSVMALFQEAQWLADQGYFDWERYSEITKTQRALAVTLGLKRIARQVGSNDVNNMGVRELLASKGFRMEGEQ